MLKDLLLAELSLKFSSQQCFLELADDRAVLAEEHRAGQLLGDGAGAFLHRPPSHVAHDSPANANGINAVVVVKAPVFGCDEGALHQQRHLAADQLVAGGGAQLLDHLAVGREHGHRARAVVAAHPLHIGEQRVDALHQQALAEGNGYTCPSPDQAGSQQRTTAPAGHITTRSLWPMAKAVTSIPSTRNGCALA